MNKPKSITVWITRDEKGEDECEKLFVHGSNPKLIDGEWGNSVASVVPELKYGKKKRIRLEIEE